MPSFFKFSSSFSWLRSRVRLFVCLVSAIIKGEIWKISALILSISFVFIHLSIKTIRNLNQGFGWLVSISSIGRFYFTGHGWMATRTTRTRKYFCRFRQCNCQFWPPFSFVFFAIKHWIIRWCCITRMNASLL